MGRIYDLFVSKYNYTDFHELNLDWLIAAIKQMEYELENFVSINAVKYADPIAWDITRQYEKNTIVIDPITGTAYISAKPVPMGVALSNTEFWNVVFDLGRFITLAAQNFANSYESVLTTTATVPTNKGDWVVWNSLLYEALNDIHVGDMYVEDGNIKRATVEYFVDKLENTLTQEIHDRESENVRIELELSDLIASEVTARETAQGNLANLVTSDKTNLVAAINEVSDALDSEITDRETKQGDLTTLNTTDKTNLVGAINEEYTYAHNSVNIINDRTGWLADLNTTDKSNLVAAINEVNTQAANIAGVVNRLDKRKFIFIGDSYMHGDSGNQSAEYVPFVSIACNNLGLTLNTDYWVSAVGGTGFTTSPTNFLTQLTSVSVPNEGAITDIIVLGGYNDNTETADNIKAAIQSFCSYAHGRFTHARVHIGMFANTYNASLKENLVKVLEAYSGALANYGFINNSQYALHNYSWFTTDSVHPNQYGQNQMAELLEHYLVNNSMSVTYPFITVSTAPGNFDVALSAKMKCTNNITSLIIEDTDVSNAALTIDCSGATRYNFGYLNTGYIRGCDSLSFTLQCFALLENSVVTPMTIEFKITGGVLYGYPHAFVYNAGSSPRIDPLAGKATLLKVIGSNIEIETLKC